METGNPRLASSVWRIAWWIIVITAAVFRLLWLDMRPPHFDEGVNGMFTDRMQTGGFYHYDPTNYHGPLHFYILFLFKCLGGRNLWALRLPTVLASIATVVWLLKFERFFGRRIAAVTALGFTLSPAYVYYGRDAIHESWLVLFMVLTAYGLFGLWQEGRRADLWAFGMGLTGMILTKETYIIHVVCFLSAAAAVWSWEQFFPSAGPLDPPIAPAWEWRDVIAVCAVGFGAIVFFYSGAFFDPAGLIGLFTTFKAWAHKSQVGEGHIKPFYYWLRLLTFDEPWALAGVAAGLALLFVKTDWRLRYLAIYGTGVLFVYSVLPYKTPWCMLAISWPFFFGFAGVFNILVRRGLARKLAGGIVLLLFVAWTGYRSARLNFFHPTDENEDYVYVQTFDQVRELTGPLLKLARENPANYTRRGLILCDSSHPIPWLLGDFSRVGYYAKNKSPLDKDGQPDFRVDFLAVDEGRVDEVEDNLDDRYYREIIDLRPNLPSLTLYFRASVFAHIFPSSRQPEFQPGPHLAKPPRKEREMPGEDDD